METGTGRRERRSWAAAACTGALLLAALSAAVYLGRGIGRIRQGMSVAGTAVGGLTREEALARLEEALAPWGDTRILLCEEGALVAQVTCREIGASLGLEEAVNQALAAGGAGWGRLLPQEPAEIRPAVHICRETLSRCLPVTPRSAQYDKESGRVEEGRVGILLDAEALEAALGEARPGGVVVFPVTTAQPALTAGDLRQALFRDVLSVCTTRVGGSDARRKNVALSAAAVDGTVLNAGETFAYNAVVGERTAQRGYGPAPAFIGGETVDSVGGGVCQTASAVYMAAMLADLEILERHAHSQAVNYVPLGCDAAVSWGGPELRFRNDTGYPLRLEAMVEGDSLTVTLVGTQCRAGRVEITGEILSRHEAETRWEETDSLPPGRQKVKQTGRPGCTVQTYRSVYSPEGDLLLRLPEAGSVYRGRDRIILVGAAKKEEGEKGA